MRVCINSGQIFLGNVASLIKKHFGKLFYSDKVTELGGIMAGQQKGSRTRRRLCLHVGDVRLSPPHCHPGVHILARDLFQYGRRLLLLCGGNMVKLCNI